MRRSRFFSAWMVLLSGCATHELCEDRVRIDGEEAFAFNVNDRRLICGDEEIEAWRDIPLSQMEFHLKSYFKGKGYYQPSFRAEGDGLHVAPGPRSGIQEIVFSGEPEEFFDLRYTAYKKQLLVSKSIDELEAWTLRRLKNMGYACAKVKVRAEYETGRVYVEIRSGIPYFFPPVRYEEGEVPAQVARRHDAFKEGDAFEQDLLDLTSGRIEGAGLATRSTFLTECKDGELALQHRLKLGEPRLLKIGVGLSTEEIPIARVSWSNTRVGHKASLLTAELYASHLRQSAKVSFEWHPWLNFSRGYLRPEIEPIRVNEKNQEYNKGRLAAFLGARMDFFGVELVAEAGPTRSFDKVYRGAAPGARQFTTLDALVQLTTHDYQIFAGNPQRGLIVKAATSSIIDSSVQGVGGHRVLVDATQLWSLTRDDPTGYVLGYRMGLRSVVDVRGLSGDLPADFFFWMGGERDVRGFSRQELGGSALSAGFLGVEFRAPAWLPKGFDPLAFYDLGVLGQTGSFRFDPGLYTSLGTGVRWASPVGVIRGTVARGFKSEKATLGTRHFQFFISLGREF